MASNISGAINNSYRITGMVSGLDTESIVQKLMSGDKARLDKMKQDRQMTEWRRDNYRSVTSLLQGFSSQYFDTLNRTSNLRSESTFSAVSIKYNGTDTSDYFSVAGSANAKPGNYTISNITLADQAKVVSSPVVGNIESATLLDTDIDDIASTGDNNRITVTLNGVSKDIVMSDNPADIDALKTDLQNKINAAFGKNPDLSPKIAVGVDALTNQNLTFSTSGTNTFSVDYAYNNGFRDILTKNINSGITLTDQNNKFKLTLGSSTKNFELPAGSVYANGDDLAAAIQGLADDNVNGFGPDKVRVTNQGGKIVLKAVGALGSASGGISGAVIPSGASKITVDTSNNSMSVTIGGVSKSIVLDKKDYTRSELLAALQSKIDGSFGSGKGIVSVDGSDNLKFEGTAPSTKVSAAAVENKGLEVIGMKDANKSNKISMSAKLYDIKNNFSTALTVNGSTDDISFTINNKTFNFSSQSTSLSTIISTVNNDSTANVKMSYDDFNNKIILQSKNAGATSTITTSDGSGGLLTSLGMAGANVTGTDASMTLNDGVNGDQQIVRSTNTFTVNGMQFTLKKNNTIDPVKLSIASDTNKIFDLVKGFVTKYNDVVDKINTELTEKKYKNYVPLTDEQKAAMKQDDITMWESKAKSGILRNDETLKGVVDGMRKVLYEPIYTDSSDKTTKLPQSLYSIGITTGAYQDKGKLIIDEDKLRDAITKTPEELTLMLYNG